MWKKIDNLQILSELKAGDIIVKKANDSSVEYSIEKIHADRIELINKDTAEKTVEYSALLLLAGDWWIMPNPGKQKKAKK